MSWTLKVGTTTKTLSEWGISNLSISRASGAADSISFSQHAQFDSEPDFPYGSAVTLKNGTTTRFVGTIKSPTRTGVAGPKLAAGSPLQYKALSPYDQLTRCTFEQQWRQPPDGEDPQSAPATVVILNQDIDGDAVATGGQIKEALDYAISLGVNLAYVTADLTALAITPPASEETDRMVSEVIQNMLRWHKDVTTWIDYSQTTPTIRFTPRSTASAVSADLHQAGVSSTMITERDDLKPDGVLIRYTQKNTVGDEEWNSFSEDSAGTTTGLNVIKMTVQLQGESKTVESAYVKTVSAPTLLSEIQNWLIDRNPFLGSDDVASIEWSSHTVSSLKSRILAGGSIPDWAGESSERGLIYARAKVTSTNGTVESVDVTNEQTFTTATSKTYENTNDYTPAEEVPVGIASALYTQLSTLQFEGSIEVKSSEVDGSFHPGKVLNLLNGRASWATMKAQIQSVTEVPSCGVGVGVTTVTFGPPKHLTAQDFIELSRVNRQRKPVKSASDRVTGKRSVNIDLSGENTVDNSASGSSNHEKLAVSVTIGEGDDAENRKVMIDPSSDGWQPRAGLFVTEDGLSMGMNYVRLVAAPEPEPEE